MSPRPLAAALLLAGLTPLVACGGKSGADDPRTLPPVVRVAVASPATDGQRRFSGVVTARVQSDLGFRVAGKVVARLVDAGQTVRRGQALMRIDATDYALAVSAQTELVEAARARAVQTASDEKRYRSLVSAGAVSALAYDQAKAAADAAKAQLEAAEAQARVSRNTAGYAVLVADADGVVVETLAEPGQVVAAGQPVVRLAQAGPREATITLPETVRPALGSLAQAFASDGAEAGQARLRQLSDAADPRTRTYEAKYVLNGQAAQAPLGSTVVVALSPQGADRGSGGVEAPIGAIYDAGKGPGVWVVEPRASTVQWRPVRLAAIGAETATISSGLAGGERFVALGAHMLHQGQRVRIQAGAAQ
ncbi:efflux RND transporter periplasmic adaptor subunit [Caulobacter sp. Root1472]|uniref:efflux RND transporter periplasmic adaptor subunit n=1 Tax=Caulobacter sp. Root1472 TaxID=1736470 RepID=UPI0006FD5FBC|nr:efflux RND transporter periplasmic adaptor subunit [Caulobacter sp. Root1472]KQZ22038.1 hemolysin secretion protein D [Caulobacter sp. Root1472]